MVILRQQAYFQITGDIEQIKAELAKESSDEPDKNESGVFFACPSDKK